MPGAMGAVAAPTGGTSVNEQTVATRGQSPLQTLMSIGQIDLLDKIQDMPGKFQKYSQELQQMKIKFLLTILLSF